MRIQPGHDVLSLFGISNSQALTKRGDKNLNMNFVIALVGAFLIVLMFGFASSAITKSLGSGSIASANTTLSADLAPAAHQPGQFVSQRIGQGYLGEYR